MSSARLFRVILPVCPIDTAAEYYGAVFGVPGSRISPGRHYFGCGEVILACFDPQADGDAWEAKPNPEHLYFLVDHLEEYFHRVEAQPNSRISRPIETQPWGERSFYFVDPFGNKLFRSDWDGVYRRVDMTEPLPKSSQTTRDDGLCHIRQGAVR
jgi:uncharacterized glyoxalase superfamily protein PhnB